MSEINKVIKYEVQELTIGGRWKAASYPLSKPKAKILYQEFKNNNSDTDFRIIKIETIETVIDNLEKWLND